MLPPAFKPYFPFQLAIGQSSTPLYHPKLTLVAKFKKGKNGDRGVERGYVHMATTTALSGLPGSKRAMRRERRGGVADAEAPQAFKEGASTLRNAQNRIHISCSATAWGVTGWG